VEAAAVPNPGEPEGRKFTLNPGGREPTGATIVVQGGEFELPEQYEKGQILELRVVVAIGEVDFRDKTDSKTGLVVDCTRVHKGRATSLKVARALGGVETDDES
jgi:hypothetical protein